MTFDPFDPCEHSFSFPISEGSDSGTEDLRVSHSYVSLVFVLGQVLGECIDCVSGVALNV